jgi:hypothetical protein
MRPELLLLSVLALALPCLVGPHALADDLPRDFTVQYQPAVASFARCYAHATISGTLKQEYPRTKKLLEQQFVLRAAEPKIRLDLTTTAQQGMGKVVGSAEAYIATPDGSLVSYRGPHSPVFDTARELSYSDTKSRIEKSCPLSSPFKVAGQGTILDLLKLPDIRVASVEKITRGGEMFVKVSYDESDGGKDQAGHSKSWFVLSPGEGWAVREYSRTTSSGDSEVTNRGILKYDGMHEGAALISRLECWQEEGPRHKLNWREILDISSFDPREPSDYYFTAFAF